MSSLKIEPLYTAKQLSDLCGGTQSVEDIRAAMHRKGKVNNPLPHVSSGNKRPILRTTLSAFEEWRKREMELSINA